jgi:hypothetical protein
MLRRDETPHGHGQTRNTSDVGPSLSQLAATILGTYKEMPGLSLHLNQAARLFGVPVAACQVALDDLVRQGQLHRMQDGQYCGQYSAV